MNHIMIKVYRGLKMYMDEKDYEGEYRGEKKITKLGK